jgi:hypothetical protein
VPVRDEFAGRIDGERAPHAPSPRKAARSLEQNVHCRDAVVRLVVEPVSLNCASHRIVAAGRELAAYITAQQRTQFRAEHIEHDDLILGPQPLADLVLVQFPDQRRELIEPPDDGHFRAGAHAKQARHECLPHSL